MGGQEVVQMAGGAAASLFAAGLTSNGINTSTTVANGAVGTIYATSLFS